MKSGTVLNRDVAGGMVFLAVGLLAVWLAADLSMGSIRLVGPGALPSAIGIGIVLLSAVMLVQAFRQKRPPQFHGHNGPDHFGLARVAAVVALIAAYTAALPIAGFLTASFVLMWALYAIGNGRPLGLFAIAAGALTSLAAYLLFVVALDVRLPKGTLGLM